MNDVIDLKNATTQFWPTADLSYLGTGRRIAPRLPLSVFGSFWADYLERSARATSAPVDYVATSLLAVASALLGNVRWPHAGASWSEPPVLRFANVGAPGSAKSPAQEAPLRLLQYAEEVMAEGFAEVVASYETERETAEAKLIVWKTQLKSAISSGDDPPVFPGIEMPRRPERPRVRISDTTAEKAGLLAAGLPRGLLLVRDELTGWIGSFDKYGGGGSDRSFWLESYQGGAYPIDRVKHPDPILISHLSIAVLGGVQPDKLAKIIGGADDGFSTRFLYAWPDMLPSFRLLREPLDETAYRNALARLGALAMEPERDDAFGPKLLKLPSEAEDLLEVFAQDTAARSQMAIGPMAAVYAKARGHVLRLATVFEHLWWCGGETGDAEPESIGRGAVAAAIQIMRDYFIPMAERVFHDAAIPHQERLAMILVRHLRQEHMRSFNARALRRAISGPLRRAEDMSIACKALEEANSIRPRSLRKSTTAGRLALDFDVNAVVYEEGAAKHQQQQCANSANSANSSDVRDFGTNGTNGTAIQGQS